jgi:predicted dehydrogenase
MENQNIVVAKLSKPKKPLKVAVLGYGYWGPHIARNLSQIGGFTLSAIIDFASDKRIKATSVYPGVSTYETFDEALVNVELDAVIIATPTSSHFALTRQALENDLHVIVEKPLTANTIEAQFLTELANTKKLVMMVDHTYLFTPAVAKIKELVESGEVGELVYFDSTRVNLGLFQPDVSVLWDLAVHDIAILQHVTGRFPTSVSATGGRHKSTKYDAASFMTLHFEDLFFAHINVSWLSPMKIRRLVLSGTKKTILFDDMLADERIRIYDVGVDLGESDLLQYRLGDVAIPKLNNSEALRTELEHFLECIMTGRQSWSSGRFGTSVVSCLEAAEKSVTSNGRQIFIDQIL